MNIAITADDLTKRFDYHPPLTDRTRSAHGSARSVCWEAAEQLLQLTPPSREQSLAITALEEAMMWANAAIARHQPKGT